MGGQAKGQAIVSNDNISFSLDFISRARAARPADPALTGDIRYLWWALSEVRSLTKEHMEVLDCSAWGDGIFASLMAKRMMPCEAHYLYVKRKHDEAMSFRKACGADCVTVPILDGRIPQCNPYDVIIIDAQPLGFRKAAGLLRFVLCHSMWRFSRVFVRHGNTPLFNAVYGSMAQTITWGTIPHTTIIHGRMSDAWMKTIAPPS